jgi:hypothetical protein
MAQLTKMKRVIETGTWGQRGRRRVGGAAVLAAAAMCVGLFGCGKGGGKGGGPAGGAAAQSRPASAPAAGGQLYVGLRRSSYGLAVQNENDGWWADRAKRFAAGFPGARPAIVEIVSTYQDDGSSRMEFAKPSAYTGGTEHMFFRGGRLDHERALALYDREGVKALIQVESGEADVADCLAAAYKAFGAHSCVIGFGVDAEWHFPNGPNGTAAGSPGRAGRPISDDAARAWMEKVLSFDGNYTLFLKHWSSKHMPPAYRHERLVFISDSQDFDSQSALMADFAAWAGVFRGSTVGYQFGYPKDRKWWSKLAAPPLDIGRRVIRDLPGARYLIWVDFTAGRVSFDDK